MKQRGKVKPMKAGSFRDSIAKTVRMLTRDQVEVSFRGFQPMVIVKGDKVLRMVLPEVNDNASEQLIEAMQGFLDHECGHIFFTPFARANESMKGLSKGGARMRRSFQNIIEDIRLEKLLPRELPGTKDNLERMYDAVMDDFFGKHIQKALAEGANAETMMGRCIVVGFRALAGQKAFQIYMDKHDLWKWLTPLTSRMPTLSKELSSMETFDDVERLVDMVLAAMDPQTKQQAEEAFEQAPPEDMAGCDQECDGEGDNEQNEGENQSDDRDDRQEQKSEPKDEGEGDDTDADDSKSDGDSGDAGDDEGNSSEGDEADEGEGGEGDDGSDDGSTDDGDSETDGEGEGHGDGSGRDDGSDEEGGDCSSDEPGGEDNGDGDGDPDEEGEEGGDSDGDGKSNVRITDALKQLEPTQRQVLYMHKNKRRSIQRIAEKMNMTEDEVKATLRDARRSLGEIYMGSA